MPGNELESFAEILPFLRIFPCRCLTLNDRRLPRARGRRMALAARASQCQSLICVKVLGYGMSNVISG